MAGRADRDVLNQRSTLFSVSPDIGYVFGSDPETSTPLASASINSTVLGMTDSNGTSETPVPPKRELSSVSAVRLGEHGDINRSYSADLIASSARVRKPFQHKGGIWACTSITGRGLTGSGETEHEAYRLTPSSQFVGVPTSYRARTGEADSADAARRDPHGFYHGITVKHGSESFVMAGPPVRFIADKAPARPDPDTPEPRQLTLF